MSAAAGFMMGGKLALSVSPPHASGAGIDGNVPSVTASAAGGSSPVTYAWTLISNPSGHAFSINSPAAATTGFFFNVPEGEQATATVRCTATSGAGSAFVDVPVTYRMKSDFEIGGP